MSKARLTHTPTPTKEQIDQILDTIADSFARQLRSPIMHAPSEQNLVFEEVTLVLRMAVSRATFTVQNARKTNFCSISRKNRITEKHACPT